MKWFLVDKDKSKYPQKGGYKDWKELLREEGRKQCVYCAISEAAFGGYRNFHVEHFRPKSRFKALTDDYGNLFYVCSICNALKGNDWPKEDPNDDAHDKSLHVYPPPHRCDLSEVLIVADDGSVSSDCASGRYLLERIYLNRPQLIRARRMAKIREELSATTQDVTSAMKGVCLDSALSTRIATAIADAFAVLDAMTQAPPYEPHEIARPTAR